MHPFYKYCLKWNNIELLFTLISPSRISRLFVWLFCSENQWFLWCYFVIPYLCLCKTVNVTCGPCATSLTDHNFTSSKGEAAVEKTVEILSPSAGSNQSLKLNVLDRFCKNVPINSQLWVSGKTCESLGFGEFLQKSQKTWRNWLMWCAWLIQLYSTKHNY